MNIRLEDSKIHLNAIKNETLCALGGILHTSHLSFSIILNHLLDWGYHVGPHQTSNGAQLHHYFIRDSASIYKK